MQSDSVGNVTIHPKKTENYLFGTNICHFRLLLHTTTLRPEGTSGAIKYDQECSTSSHEPQYYGLDTNIGYFIIFTCHPFSTLSSGVQLSRVLVPLAPRTVDLTQTIVFFNYFYMPPPSHSILRGAVK